MKAILRMACAIATACATLAVGGCRGPKLKSPSFVYRAPEEVVSAVLDAGIAPERVRVVEHKGQRAVRIDLTATEDEARAAWVPLAGAVRSVGGGDYTRVLFAIRSPDRLYWEKIGLDVSRDQAMPSRTISVDSWHYVVPPAEAPF